MTLNSAQEEDLDSVMSILGNPTRRLILERLSHEPSYALQIAQDLGMSQQLIASHLKGMEDAQLISSDFEESDKGPPRRIYTLRKSLLLTLELAPYLFKSRIISFSSKPTKGQLSDDSFHYLEQLDSIGDSTRYQNKMQSYTDILMDLDMKLDQLERERAVLLYVRNLVRQKASDIVTRFDDLDVRRVLYHILNSHDDNVETVSRRLNMREELVRAILVALKDNTILSDDEVRSDTIISE